MKIKILMACLIMLSAASTGISQSKNPKGNSDYRNVIDDYIASYTTSDYKKLDKILSDDAYVKIPRGDANLTHSRSMLITEMKQQAGVTQNCEASYKVLAQCAPTVLAVVSFKYDVFIQHNYVLLEKEDAKWKIKSVYKMFEDVKSTETPNALVNNR